MNMKYSAKSAPASSRPNLYTPREAVGAILSSLLRGNSPSGLHRPDQYLTGTRFGDSSLVYLLDIPNPTSFYLKLRPVLCPRLDR